MPNSLAVWNSAISPNAPGEVVAIVLPRKSGNVVMPGSPISIRVLLSTAAPT